MLLASAAPRAAAAQTGLAHDHAALSPTIPVERQLPGVTVTATNQATNYRRHPASPTTPGNYCDGPALPIGPAIVPGLHSMGSSHVNRRSRCRRPQTARIDFKLEVGAVQEADRGGGAPAPVLQTENAVVGRTFEREQIEAAGVRTQRLAAAMYAPGVTKPNSRTFDGLRGGARAFVNGAARCEQSNNFTIDGIDANEAIDNNIAYQPSPDAVEQVERRDQQLSPELGNVAGAVVSMVIKSGTNDYRGNAFYYWRDNALAATSVGTEPQRRPEVRVLAQHLRLHVRRPGSLRNKLFFFGDYQGARQEQPPTDAFTTVVPDAWRNGDLSSLTATIRDPG